MQYLVEMIQGNFINTPSEGIALIELYVMPTLHMAKKLQAENKILSGGALAAEIGFAFIIEANSAEEIDGIIAGFPIWPRMRTKVTPLISFEGREQTIQNRLQAIKARMAERKNQTS